MAFLHASASGYFPFCITEEGDVGDNTSNPVGMSLEDAMALYWKPKTFRIVESWNTTWGGGGYPVVTVNGSTDVTLSAVKTKMSERVCPPFDTIASQSAGTFTKINPSATPPSSSGTDTLTLQLFFQEPLIIEQGELYYPNIVFTREAGLNLDYWDWRSTGASGSYGFFYNAEIKINGNSYPFSMFSIAAVEAVSTSCTSVITIDEETAPE